MGFPERVQTERLRLDRPRTDDLAELAELIADPRVPETQFPARFRRPEDTERALRRAIEHWERRGFGPWALRVRGDDRVAGRVGLMTADLDGGERVEVKWFLGVERWGHGYATEAARAALDAGFEHLGLEEIVARTMTTNAGSQAVMRRLGMARTGCAEHAGLPHVLFAVRRRPRT